MANYMAMLDASRFLTEQTAWIVGAGASYDSRSDQGPVIPMTAKLVSAADIPSDFVPTLRRLIARGTISAETLTDALTGRLETTIDVLRGLAAGRDPALAAAAANCLRVVNERIVRVITGAQTIAWMPPDGKGPRYSADNYLWLAACCAHLPQWSVITLNYDELLDWAFRAIRAADVRPQPVQYERWEAACDSMFRGTEMPSSDGGLYLKLHGCLSLYACMNVGCSRYRAPIDVAGPRRRTIGISLREPDVACHTCRERLHTLIIPPGRNKTREETRYHEIVYGLAEAALMRANRWTILGYSAPEYDDDIAALLKRAIQAARSAGSPPPEITVVNPSAEEIAIRLASRLQWRVGALKSSFSAFAQRMWMAMEVTPPHGYVATDDETLVDDDEFLDPYEPTVYLPTIRYHLESRWVPFGRSAPLDIANAHTIFDPEGATLLGLADTMGSGRRDALDLYEKALARFREAGDLRGEATVLGTMGERHDAILDPLHAAELFASAKRLFEEVGDRSAAAIASRRFRDCRRQLAKIDLELADSFWRSLAAWARLWWLS
jgi:hypothetical protein